MAAATEWLRRWMGLRVPTRGWAADCPAGLPVPDAPGCTGVNCDSIGLAALAPGERACVTCLMHPDSPAAAKLSALGVLPGSELELVQRSPAYVLAIGYAEIAIDVTLAETVRVRKM